MKLLLTGASGYIGSHTALSLLKNTNYSLLIYDNLSTGFIENFKCLEALFPNRVEFVKGDLGDFKTLDSLFSANKFEAVLHFGASLIVSESVEKPLLYYTNNTINTTNLIQTCLKFGVNKFIFSSTAAVYGEPESSLMPIKEIVPLHPINPYGTSKMMSELVMRDVSKASDFRYIALRYFNVAGASMDNTKENLAKNIGLGQRSKNATHLIKVAVECAVGKRESMSIFGNDYETKDGTCIRDYIHIDDLANAHVCAFESLVKNNKSDVFNVGYGLGYSVKEVIECVKKVSGVDFKVNLDSRRAGDPAILISSNEKLLKNTSWKPKFDNLELIIKSAYEWEKHLKTLS